MTTILTTRAASSSQRVHLRVHCWCSLALVAVVCFLPSVCAIARVANTKPAWAGSTSSGNGIVHQDNIRKLKHGACKITPYNQTSSSMTTTTTNPRTKSTTSIEVEFMLAIKGEEKIDEYIKREIHEHVFDCIVDKDQNHINSPTPNEMTQQARDLGIISLTVLGVVPGKK